MTTLKDLRYALTMAPTSEFSGTLRQDLLDYLDQLEQRVALLEARVAALRRQEGGVRCG